MNLKKDNLKYSLLDENRKLLYKELGAIPAGAEHKQARAEKHKQIQYVNGLIEMLIAELHTYNKDNIHKSGFVQ